MSDKTQKINKVAAGLCSVGLVAVGAYLLANMTWSMMPTAEAAALPPATVVSRPGAPAARWNSTWLRQQPMFGQVSRRQVARAPTRAPAPSGNVQRANLQGVRLTGLITYDDANDSRAIIDIRGKTQLRKRGDVLDAKLYAGVIVADILVDRIMLNQNGTMKELLLEKFAKAGNPQRTVVRNNRVGVNRAAVKGGAFRLDKKRKPAQQLNDLRNFFKDNPNKIMEVAPQYVRWRQHKVNGQIAGYKIYAGGKGRQLFKKSGLKNGDIVKAVNNMPVNNPLAIAEMGATQSSFSLTINRRGQEQVVNVNLAE